jgi:CBS domain containing-hemolysin-like protein
MSPWLVAMAVLIACSAFFSGSEAALFYLRWEERRRLSKGSSAQRVVVDLLKDPDRLLSAVLLWNLAINMTYFGISSIVSLRFEQAGAHPQAAAFSATALLAIIFCSEMLPKSMAVLSAQRVAGWVAIPLAVTVRIVDPVMPILRLASLLSRRLIWPRFAAEPYLEVSDLERAIELSSSDAPLIDQERATLRNIVMLSDIRADEWMRPRTQFVTFRAPVALSDLEGKMTPSGYLLVTQGEEEDITSAIDLGAFNGTSDEDLTQHAHAIVCVPWCATVADVLQRLQHTRLQVAVVVNEFGETIGILTFADILATVFHENPSRSDRLLDREPIQDVAEGVWHLTGMTSLRRLARHFQTELPDTTSVTVGGMIQDLLQRLAERGDEVEWGEFRFRVLKAPRRGQLLIEMSRLRGQEEPS